jgi:excisionase family DNA binding protein
MTDELIKSIEIAEYLGVPSSTLAQWRYQGKGPKFLKIGRHARYRWSDVETWLSGQTRTNTRSACDE